MEFGRNSNRRFAVKNKEIKQIFFSRKKNKKWIIIALVLVLTCLLYTSDAADE